ncbi:V-type proton ATPase subunit G [Morella rubra]|uniref:V-type proton ATPase subunit G n=1 Tax=Morella rubra TaxID=262757 RepID=A0A6A1UWE2_9ROSI|nr:V-type proton ATPase subunit G [Morella rubra]
MDSFRGQGGIQKLLIAEQEAQDIVSYARNLPLSVKSTRLKKTKEEAESEVGLYGSHLEAELQKKISKTSGSSGNNAKRLEEETEVKIQNLNESASRVSPGVSGMLIKHVTTVKN